MVEFYFIVRHIPWWAVPFIILGGEFAYFFWLKKKKKSAYVCVMAALIGFLFLGFYIWAGGPNKSVKILKKMHRDYE
jgi:hypothetical protein